jgi:SOS-response transcriptional repressor LexA
MDRKQLTVRQTQVYGMIRDYIAEHGYAPSMRDIAEHFGISSNGSWCHVRPLVRRGWIAFDPHRSRGISLVAEEWKTGKPLPEMPDLGALNPKETRVYRFIRTHMETEGMPPSCREISHHFGFKSMGTAHNYLKQLEEHGLIRTEPRKARAITILEAKR